MTAEADARQSCSEMRAWPENPSAMQFVPIEIAPAPASSSFKLPISSLATLRSAFGNTIVDNAVQMLGVDPASEELTFFETESVNALCGTCRSAYAGLNFFSKLSCSAQGESPAFQAAAAAAGVDTALLSASDRRRIDEAFSGAFDLAARHDSQCIDLDAARALMRLAIDSALKCAPETQQLDGLENR